MRDNENLLIENEVQILSSTGLNVYVAIAALNSVLFEHQHSPVYAGSGSTSLNHANLIFFPHEYVINTLK